MQRSNFCGKEHAQRHCAMSCAKWLNRSWCHLCCGLGWAEGSMCYMGHIGTTWQIWFNCPCVAVMWSYVTLLWPLVIISVEDYGDGVDNTIEENSSVFSVVWMHQLPSARSCGSKTFIHWNSAVLNWCCRLRAKHIDLYNIHKTSGYATMVHGRGCNPHCCTTTFANVEITSLMTS